MSSRYLSIPILEQMVWFPTYLGNLIQLPNWSYRVMSMKVYVVFPTSVIRLVFQIIIGPQYYTYTLSSTRTSGTKV